MSELRTHTDPLPLPDFIAGKPNMRLEHACLVHGIVFGRYSNTGDVVQCVLSRGDKARANVFNNKDPIVSYTLTRTDMISNHGNKTLQVLRLGTESCTLFSQDNGLYNRRKRDFILMVIQANLKELDVLLPTTSTLLGFRPSVL